MVTKEDGLKQLKPSATGNATIFDEFAKLRAIIQNDGVLSERQAGTFVGDLNLQINGARKGISVHSEAVFHERLAQVRSALASGEKPKGPAGKAFVDEIANLSDSRAANRKSGSASADKIISTIHFMPKTLELVASTGGRRR